MPAKAIQEKYMLGEKKGFFGRMSERINDALMMNPTIDEDFFDELEEIDESEDGE